MSDSAIKNLDALLYDGLYPAICAGKNKARLFYPSYVKTYLEKDVRDLLKIKNQMQFMKFMEKTVSVQQWTVWNLNAKGV